MQGFEEYESKILAVHGFNQKDTTPKVNILIVAESEYCSDSEIPAKLNNEVFYIRGSVDGKNIKLINEGVKKINNKNIGFYEYTIEDENSIMYQYVCLYSIDEKLVSLKIKFRLL